MLKPNPNGPGGEDTGLTVKKDYTIDVLKLLDKLKEDIERIRGFAVLSFGGRRDDLIFQIEKIRASMPRDVRENANAARERERMLDDARAEADSTIAQAKREAETALQEAQTEAKRILEEARIAQSRMVDESEVLKIAKSQAEEVRSAAEKEARQMRAGADQYAFSVLTSVEKSLSKFQMEVERGKNELESIERDGPSRERVRA